MTARLQRRWDALHASYWFVPSVMTLLVCLLWLMLGVLDDRLHRAGAAPISWLYHDSVETARTLLLAISGATIGIIGVVFSITMVPLTIAASQFGPRLLRTFLRDTGTQVVLGTFVATFVFCLLVVFQLRDDTEALPQLSVTVGFGFALASLGVLIYFINHVAVSIQAPQVVAAVVAELDADMERAFPPRAPGAQMHSEPPRLPSETPQIVLAASSGYVQARDDEALLKLASEDDLLIELFAEPGSFVIRGTRLAHLWPATGSKRYERTINVAHILGPQRTLVQDIEFGINELVEVAVRALSPAINDPFTAMTCLDWLGHTLCRLCARSFPAPYRVDSDNVPRLFSTPLTFRQLTESAFNPIREYGRTSVVVTLRLLETLERILQCAVSDEQRQSVLYQVQLVAEGAQDELAERMARDVVGSHARQLLQTADISQTVKAEA